MSHVLLKISSLVTLMVTLWKRTPCGRRLLLSFQCLERLWDHGKAAFEPLIAHQQELVNLTEQGLRVFLLYEKRIAFAVSVYLIFPLILTNQEVWKWHVLHSILHYLLLKLSTTSSSTRLLKEWQTKRSHAIRILYRAFLFATNMSGQFLSAFENAGMPQISSFDVSMMHRLSHILNEMDIAIEGKETDRQYALLLELLGRFYRSVSQQP